MAWFAVQDADWDWDSEDGAFLCQATNDAEARGHFGLTDQDPPICLTQEEQT